MMNKAPCKFKGGCRLFKEGKACTFSHEVCKFGNRCNDIQNCRYYHDQGQSVPGGQGAGGGRSSKFDTPIGEVECKFGANCNRMKEGKCSFKHSDSSMPSQPFKSRGPPMDNRGGSLCKFGPKCKFLQAGTCKFKHQDNMMSESQPNNSFHSRIVPNNSFNSRIESLPASIKEAPKTQFLKAVCPEYLSTGDCQANKQERCPKIHALSTTKSIQKIFTLDNSKYEAMKIFILDNHQPEIFVVVCRRLIKYMKLTNLARQAGHQQVRTNKLLLKNVTPNDHHIQQGTVINSWLVKAEGNEQKDDILILKFESSIGIIVINKGISFKFDFPEQIVSVICADLKLFILTTSGRVIAIQYNILAGTLAPLAINVSQPLLALKCFQKKIEQENIVAGIMQNGFLCFFNGNRQTLSQFKIDLRSLIDSFTGNIIDICFIQYDQYPALIVLSSTGKLIAFNLINLEPIMTYDTELPTQNNRSSICTIHSHLIVAVDNLGVFVYNSKDFSQMLGMLTMGKCQYSMIPSSRGLLSLTIKDSYNQEETSLFKFTKI